MSCKHERLRTVGENDVFCCLCGEKLTLEFLANQGKPAEPEAEPKPKKPARKKKGE